MKFNTKKLLLTIAFLCLAAAVLIIILMPKPEKVLPELPEAIFNTEIRNIETNKNGYIKIIKFPVVSSSDGRDLNEFNSILRQNEEEYCNGSNFPYQENQSASYIIHQYNIMLQAGDFLSCKAEGTYSNSSEDYYFKILKSVNYNVATGETIGFDEVVSDLKKFYKAFSNGKFTMTQSNDTQLDSKSSEELLGNFQPAYSIYPDYYIDGEYFVIIADVPEVFGGYTEYRISLIEAEAFLNKNCDYIKMIYNGKY